jgi:glycosyltransferase involved in cell wall biosynthesis
MRWADTFRAEIFKREWKDDEVDIASAMEPLPEKEYDVIHFLFSGGLSKHKDYILRHADKVFTSLASERTFKMMHNNQDDLREIYKKTVCCVCQNPSLVKRLQRFIKQHNMVYIPNGVDTELFNHKIVAGFVGAKGSYEHKGYYLAKQACDELGIELKVAHEHTYTHEQMPEFYKQIDCLLIPSLSEGCNNPTLEALSMNIPVISTDVGIAKILGCVIIDRDIESLKTALLNLNRRFLILSDYTWPKIAEQYKSLYLKYVEK